MSISNVKRAAAGVVCELLDPRRFLSATAMPAGVMPYSDPSNPYVIGIDEDGLIIQTINPNLAPSTTIVSGPTQPGLGGVATSSTYGGSVGGLAASGIPSDFPADVTPVSDPTDPYIVGVDKDGLTIKRMNPTLSAAETIVPGLVPVGPDGILRSDSYGGAVPERGLTAQAVGGSFNIVLQKSSALLANSTVSALFDKAANYVETLFDDSTTIYIDADYTNLGNSSTVAQTGSVKYEYVNGYADLRADLTASNNSSTEAIVDQLPTSPTWAVDSGISVANPLITGANLQALGYNIARNANNASQYSGTTRRDATLRFNSAFAFDLNPADGVASSSVDFYSAAVHEILHAMGFSSGIDELITARILNDRA